MKECKVCKKEKDWLQFYKDKSRSDGFARECKECCNIRKKKFVEENREHVREIQRENSKKHVGKKSQYSKKRYTENRDEILAKNRENYSLNRDRIRKRQNELNKTPERRAKSIEARKKWYLSNRDKVRKIEKNYISENRHKIRAHYAISDAIRRGKMTRPDQCEVCKILCKPDAHHDDYSKKLDVRWLCKLCHAKETFK